MIWAAKEDDQLAFIRRKKVRGYEYYQAVRNYRDEDGKHRQEVLYHLGPHNSFSARRLWLLEKVNIYRGSANRWRKRAEALRYKLLDVHGSAFVDGMIPSEEECAREHDWWEEQYDALLEDVYYHTYSETESMDAIEIETQIEKYRDCLKHHAATRLAEQADHRAEDHQAKLDKLLRIQRQYF